MAEPTTFVFDTNPQAANALSRAEVALVRELFADFDKAWNHPSLQDRLRQARSQNRDIRSSLNGMTLFGVIWTTSKQPGYHTSQYVWNAMRVELENGGVLAKLVSKFNASVTKKSNMSRRGIDARAQTESVSPQPIGITISNAWDALGHHKDRQDQWRTRETKSSSKNSSYHFPQSSDMAASSKFLVRSPPPAPGSRAPPTPPFSNSIVSFSDLSGQREFFNNQEELSLSSFPREDLYLDSSLSSGSYEQRQSALPNADSFTPGGAYENERFEQRLDYPSPLSTHAYTGNQSSAAKFGVVPGPFDHASTQSAARMSQPYSSSSQAYRVPNQNQSFSQPGYSSYTSASTFSMTPYDAAFVPSQTDYLGGNPNTRFGNGYESMPQNGGGFGHGGMYMQQGTMNYSSDHVHDRGVSQQNWGADYTHLFDASFGAGSSRNGDYRGC